MPKILKQLIQQYCPNGVGWKPIGDISLEVKGGFGIPKRFIGTGDFPCVSYWEIYGTYNVWFDKCTSSVNKDLVKKKVYLESGDLVVINNSMTFDMVGKCCVYTGKEKILVGSDTIIIKHNQNPKYLSYALSTDYSKQQKVSSIRKGAKAHYLSPNKFKRIKIPLPSLEIQNKIVEILDKFRDVEIELNKELENRRKQYEYYSDKIFRLGGGVKPHHQLVFSLRGNSSLLLVYLKIEKLKIDL